MPHRLLRRIASSITVAAAVLAVAAAPASVAACSSEQPTFEQAMAGAQAVAWVKVDLAPDGEVQRGISPLLVTDVIHGDPGPFIGGDLRTGLCGDTIHYLYGDDAMVLVAFGVPFFDQLIAPSWGRGEDGALVGTAGMPFGVRTIDDVESAVRERFTVPQAGASGPVSFDGSWVVIAALALGTIIGWRIVLRRSPQ